MTDIIVIGSCNMDMVVKTARMPGPGETVLGGDFFMINGGKGANQAVAAARLGGRVALIGKVGDDIFGNSMIDDYRKEKINIDYLDKAAEYKTGVAMITIDEKGENSIVVASGANMQVDEALIVHSKSIIENASVVLMQHEIPLTTVKYAAAVARAKGVNVILNPAPAQAVKEDILQHVSVLTPNEHEAFHITGIEITGEQAMAEAAQKISSMGVDVVIITLGERGAYLHEKCKGGTIVPGFKANAVDTTAAGDTFNGALAVAITEGMGLEEAVRFANKAAAISVSRMGAQPSVPYRNELKR